jgi:hypothetical protein
VLWSLDRCEPKACMVEPGSLAVRLPRFRALEISEPLVHLVVICVLDLGTLFRCLLVLCVLVHRALVLCLRVLRVLALCVLALCVLVHRVLVHRVLVLRVLVLC